LCFIVMFYHDNDLYGLVLVLLAHSLPVIVA
jgi:hypothetical protein